MSDPDRAGTLTASLSWRSGHAPTVFFLQGAKDVIRQAEAVLHPWLSPSVAAGDPPRKWSVDEVPEDGGWRVDSPSGRGIVVSTVQDAVREVEFESAGACYLEHPEGFAFHGALVSRSGIGVMLLGPSQTGKSTLACALWSRGWTLHSDDGVLVDPESHWALPTTRRISIRHPSRRLLGESTWSALTGGPATSATSDSVLCHPLERDGGERARGASLRLIALLRHPDAEQASSGDRLLAVAAHANGKASRAGRAFAAAAQLMTDVPVVGLEPASLESLVARVEDLAESTT